MWHNKVIHYTIYYTTIKLRYRYSSTQEALRYTKIPPDTRGLQIQIQPDKRGLQIEIQPDTGSLQIL